MWWTNHHECLLLLLAPQRSLNQRQVCCIEEKLQADYSNLKDRNGDQRRLNGSQLKFFFERELGLYPKFPQNAFLGAKSNSYSHEETIELYDSAEKVKTQSQSKNNSQQPQIRSSDQKFWHVSEVLMQIASSVVSKVLTSEVVLEVDIGSCVRSKQPRK